MGAMRIGTCDHCGRQAFGSDRFMFYWFVGRLQGRNQFPGLPGAREFICCECQRQMRRYGMLGLSLLLGLVVAGFVLVWSYIL